MPGLRLANRGLAGDNYQQINVEAALTDESLGVLHLPKVNRTA